MTFSVGMAWFLTVAMVTVAVLTWFYHDNKHRDLDSWIEYGFSGDTLRHALIYYRSMFISMAVFYVLFVVSCLALQSDGYQLFVTKEGEPVVAGPVGSAFFGLDLVLRGGFFDVMEHFNLSTTSLLMDRSNRWFVLYCFAFRIYYGLTLIRIAFSFVWIWAKIRQARRGAGAPLMSGRTKTRRRLRLRPKMWSKE